MYLSDYLENFNVYITETKMNTREEQDYFFDMFNEMWEHSVGEVMPEEDQYSLAEELAKLECERIFNALKLACGNQTKAAQSLNIGRTALIAKMKKYRIT